MRFFEAFKYYCLYFGVKQALSLVVLPRVCSKLHINDGQMYINQLLSFQRSICKEIVSAYKVLPLSNEKLSDSYRIWTLWWQGEDNMPDVIRHCHNSLLRNSNGHEVVLITKTNLHKYVRLPEYIYQKVREGKISFSHFSDLIRLSLLSTYGGRWIDAALFVTKPLLPITSLHMAKMNQLNTSICQGRWCFGDIGGASTCKIFKFMLDCLLQYWSQYDAPVDYLMFDGFLRIAYEDMPDVHESIDNLPVYSPNLHESRYHFNEKYEKERLDNLISNNELLSLTWRINYPIVTEDNELTYYGKLIQEENTRCS